MAGQRPTTYHMRGNNDPPRSNIVYVEPYNGEENDRQSIPEREDSALQRTAEYVSGLNPNGETHPPDHYAHPPPPPHHYSLPPLTIRRHVPGSTDPSLQRMPSHLLPSENVSSSSNIHVTIKRNSISREMPPIPPVIQQPIQPPIQPIIQPHIQPIIQPHIQPIIQPTIQPIIQPSIQPVIQPILYPVPIYMNPPTPQYPTNQPIEPIVTIRELPKPRSPVKTSPVPPHQPLEPITPRKELPKPRSPVKHSPIPPISPNRYDPEPFRSSGPRNRNTTPASHRPSVRLDEVTPSPPTLKPQRVRPGRVVMEEYDDYDEYYRVPSVHSVPQKVISYRNGTSIPGMTTRELENHQMDRMGKSGYVESPRLQTVTYRTA